MNRFIECPFCDWFCRSINHEKKRKPKSANCVYKCSAATNLPSFAPVRNLFHSVMIFQMIKHQRPEFLSLACAVYVIFMSSGAVAAQSRVRDRIAGRIETESSIVLRGHVHPLANSKYDRGEVGKFYRLQRVTMMLKP